MKALAFTVSCLHCGSDCSLLAPGRSTGATTRAMVKCCSCGREALVRVAIEPVASPQSVRRRQLRLVSA